MANDLADELERHFPTGARQLHTRDLAGKPINFCIGTECSCGAAFSGPDVQDVQAQWAIHVKDALRRPVPADVAGVAVKAFSADPHNPATLRVHFAQPVTPADRNSLMAAINRFNSSARCSLGVGCDEVGICYAAAHSQPEQCGSHEITLASGRGEVFDNPSDDLNFILGQPCFTFIRYAQTWRAAGHKIAEQAESEQAFFIGRMLHHYFAAPTNWREKWGEEIESVIASIPTPPQGDQQ